jgi:hypothetical protein
MNSLSQYVTSQAPVRSQLKPLPLIHTTSAFVFRNIIEDGMKISPRRDNLFNENLLYLFYGKPVYIRRGQDISSFLSYAPIYFVLSPDMVSSARRLFPFDSGAFASGLFKAYTHTGHTIEDFQIDLDSTSHGSSAFPDTATRFVDAIYGSNTDYYYNRIRPTLNYDPINFEIEAYLNLIKSK